MKLMYSILCGFFISLGVFANGISSAGVPVALPKTAKPKFLKANSLQVSEGVLSGFSLNGNIYKGYYYKGQFKGYKTEKGGQPYQFLPLPDESNIRAIIALHNPYLACNDLFLKGKYIPETINPTGEGAFLIGERVLFSEESPLLELFADYTTCLPDISRVSYDNAIWGYYNYFGKGGFLKLVQDNSGTLTYLYSIASGENGAIQNFQYNNSTGRWFYFSEPPHGCLSCELTAMFNALYDISAIGHFVLDAAGMAPLIGEAFDLANGIWYTMEGDKLNASLSFAATIPLVYTTGVKYVGKIVKLGDGSYCKLPLKGNCLKVEKNN